VTRRAGCLAAGVLALLVVAGRPELAAQGLRTKPRMSPLPTATHSSLATITETEPNDLVSQSTLVALNDTVGGTIDPVGDADHFALDVAAGTILALDVDAWSIGSSLDPVLTLLGPDSVTVLARNDDADFLVDSYIEYIVPVGGRYFIRLVDYSAGGGATYAYTLKIGVISPGPGDPTTVVATGLGRQLGGMAASATGDLYVADVIGRRIVRVAPDGSASTFVSTGSDYPRDVVVDGFGNILVTVTPYLNVHGCVDSRVLRYSPSGHQTVFANLERGHEPLPITVGPDGDVRVVAWRSCTFSELERFGPWLFRLDRDGNKTDSLLLETPGPTEVPEAIAYSPSGVLHYAGHLGVYRVAAGGPVRAITGAGSGIAFDRDGYLYVGGDDASGSIHLYSPSYQNIDTPFAVSNLDLVSSVQFGRSPSGEMTSRLFAVTSYGGGAIVELNSAAIRAPGFRVGVDLLRVATTALLGAVMGGDYADTIRLESPPGPVTWSVTSGALPPGVTLDAGSGVIAGVPEDSGTFRFTARGTSGALFGVGTFSITVTTPTVRIVEATEHLLGGTPLTPHLQRYLDLQGNRNGRFDVGDLRALLRDRGQLPGQSFEAQAGRPRP
jgi:sugar lactone lactonase YvrE